MHIYINTHKFHIYLYMRISVFNIGMHAYACICMHVKYNLLHEEASALVYAM